MRRILTILTILFVAQPAMGETPHPDDRAYAKASGAFSAATGAMIIGGIETASDGFGVGVGNIAGHLGIGAKISRKIARSARASVGAFRIEDGISGFAVSFSWRF